MRGPGKPEPDPGGGGFSTRTTREVPYAEPRRERPPAAPGESADAPLSIDDLAAVVKTVVGGAFPPLWVEGEVTKFTRHRSGHWYFSLKGRNASIACVVWASTTRWLPATPDEGMQVIACGQLGVYESRTEVRFVVSKFSALGDGLWRKAFEETRARLEAAGLLDPARKRRVPFFPRRVAVVTSADGAVLHDIVSVVARRNPQVEVVLIPAAVQGDEAVGSLCTALNRLARWGGADVAIIGRGGGSREDLWAFNDERLARKVAACPVPIISAVGHEIDTTLCDLVADFRAPTPSAAAELAVPMLSEIQRLMSRLQQRLGEALGQRARTARRAVEHCARRVTFAAQRVVDQRRLRLEGVGGRLNALSPLATLARGYAVAVNASGQVVSSVAGIDPGDSLTVRVRDGRLRTTVESAEPEARRET